MDRASVLLKRLAEVLGKALEADFAHTLLADYIPYDTVKRQLYKLLKGGVKIRLQKKIPLEELRQKAHWENERALERLLRRFFTRGVELAPWEAEVPEPWPDSVTYEEEEGDEPETYIDALVYTVKGKGRLEGDALVLDEVVVRAEPAGDPQPYSDELHIHARPLELD